MLLASPALLQAGRGRRWRWRRISNSAGVGIEMNICTIPLPSSPGVMQGVLAMAWSEERVGTIEQKEMPRKAAPTEGISTLH